MQKAIFIIFLFLFVRPQTYFRLDSSNPIPLKVGDRLISTLGHFTATLQTSQCSLKIQMFDEETQKYENKGNFKSPSSTLNCKSLEISDGKVVTDTGNTYAQVSSQSFNSSTIFTIDDQGVLRLIGTYIKSNRVDQVSAETNYTEFQVQPPYFRAFSNLNVDFMTRVAPVSNKRNWKYIAEFGQLTIYFAENPAHKLDYVYSSISIKNSQIFDFSDETFPGILYNNITFSPRCFEPRLYLNFKPPFVFTIDPYWPTFKVYEQGKYQLIDLTFSKISNYDFENGFDSFNYAQTYSPCPLKTFEYKGDCVGFCPKPYYHQMKGNIGRCVLNCEQFTPKDESKRICSCTTEYEKIKLNAQVIKKCPSTANASPYGCYCKNEGEYYDQKYTFDCVKKCPQATYPHNGICMDCSFNCLTCQQDNFYRAFLQCQQCIPGYKVFKGQCVKECISNYGLSLFNEQCTKCDDVNCRNCQNDPKVCLQCNIMNSLENGTCKGSCSSGLNAVYTQYFDTQCLAPSQLGCVQMLTSHFREKPFLKCDMCIIGLSHLDKCVTECPSGYYNHNQKYCACAGIKNMTIGDQCFDLPGCPITMSFDIRSHSCLSCPFGCMSCINTQCTSCNPGYFLYISPQSILCRRKGPLFPCDKQYQLVRGICRVKDYINIKLQMTLCSTQIPNCEVCIPRSPNICIMCAQNYLIFNNTCVESCPEGLTPYENTCVLLSIEDCVLPHFSSTRQSAIVKITEMQESHAYRHYIYGNREPANDPIGYISYFQKLTTQKSDGVPRQTEFFQPYQVCLKCKDGLGMSDDFKQCLPCPSQCKTCYLAKNYSCLTKEGQEGGGGDEGNKTENDCKAFKDSQTGKCLQSCNDEDKFPDMEEGKLICNKREKASIQDYGRVDSAIYRNKDGTELVFFVFGEKLKKNVPVNILISKTRFSEKRLLQGDDDIEQKQLQIRDGSYVQIQNGTSGIYIMNLTGNLLNLTSQNDILFPNQIYGTTDSQTHINFMQTWLAHIGYIMSIVIIILHIVYIGNELLYKVDNLMIFVQTIFYFSFVKNLAGRLLAQFYFGWSWSHARFLPNLFAQAIPDHYFEEKAPPSFKIFNIDGNFFRNAGFSLSWLLLYIGIFIIITLVIWGVLYKTKGRKEAWYPKVARQALIGGFEFFSMNIIFFAMTQLIYSEGAESKSRQYFDSSQGLAIFSLVLITAYTIARFFFNTLGGIYMCKRAIIAMLLAGAYQNYVFIAPLLLLQIIFSIARYIVEGPEENIQKISICLEGLVLIGSYLLMFLVLDAGVNCIIISIIVFLFIVYLSYDLTTIYLESRNEFLVEEVQSVKQEEQPIKVSKLRPSRIQGSRQGSKIVHSRLSNGSGLQYGERSENARQSAMISDKA